MEKFFLNDIQQIYWNLFENGPEGLKGNPLLMIEFMEIEQERKKSVNLKQERVR